MRIVSTATLILSACGGTSAPAAAGDAGQGGKAPPFVGKQALPLDPRAFDLEANGVDLTGKDVSDETLAAIVLH